MTVRRILADAYFDGETRFDRGPFLISVDGGMIMRIECAARDGRRCGRRIPDARLVEAHAHVFLDGALVDADARNARLTASVTDMLATARDNLAKSTRAGVTVVRDAGDRYGINHAMRDELAAREDAPIELRSPGPALKRAKRYGAFIGNDVAGGDELRAAVAELCRASDDIKIILTGVVDFADGCVKGAPQFDVDELRLIVTEAHARNRKTFAHCSGLAGLETAVAAGVDSIEHGYFITRDILGRMADKRIAWAPTFAPVHFQWAEPQHAGWDRATVGNLSRLLDDHAQQAGHAHELGVAVLAGSDAGSPGVDHGDGLIDELLHLLRAGLPMQAVLRAATSLPRALWNMQSARIAPGSRADMILLGRSPFDDPSALRNVRLVVKGGCCVPVGASGRAGARPASASDDDEFDISLPCISPCPPER